MKIVKLSISLLVVLTMFIALIPNQATVVSAASSQGSVTSPEVDSVINSDEEVAKIEQDSEELDEGGSNLDSSAEATDEEENASEEEVPFEEGKNTEYSVITLDISDESTEESSSDSSTDSLNNAESTDASQTRAAASPTISYRTHVQTYGWQDYVLDSNTSGTTGKAKRLEGIQLKLDSSISGSIQYRTHVQTYGWQNWVSDGALSGTTGQAKRLEAIQIQLTGEMAKQYDVYYRVHAQTFGWMGWAKNGESAGTTGYGKRLEAIQIVLVKKGGSAPGSTIDSFKQAPTSVNYSTHIQSIGWQSSKKDGVTSGTSGQSKRLESMKINLSNKEYGGSIQYRAHVQTYGWQDWKSEGALSGTTGQSKRLEAIQIKLTGEMANQYDVYYRVHTQKFGWLNWAKNGESAGTSGYSYRAEAIQVVLVKKGEAAPGSTTTPFKKPELESVLTSTIFIDPGHGGNDPGTTYGSYRESDITLSVSKMLNTIITNRSGMNVMMTRTEDSAQGITYGSGVASTAESLTRRTDFAKANKQTENDVYVSIHVNSFTNSSVSGAETYFYGLDAKDATRSTNPYVEDSKALAHYIQNRIVKMVDMKDRSAKHGNYAVLRNNGMPAVLTELGFLTNSSDRVKLTSSTYQQKFAEAIYQGILDYYESKGISVNSWR